MIAWLALAMVLWAAGEVPADVNDLSVIATKDGWIIHVASVSLSGPLVVVRDKKGAIFSLRAERVDWERSRKLTEKPPVAGVDPDTPREHRFVSGVYFPKGKDGVEDVEPDFKKEKRKRASSAFERPVMYRARVHKMNGPWVTWGVNPVTRVLSPKNEPQKGDRRKASGKAREKAAKD